MLKRDSQLWGRMLRALSAGPLLLLLAGCISNPLVTLTVYRSKHKPFVIVQSEAERGWGAATHPYLVSFGSNLLMMTYWISGDGNYSGVANVDWPMYSTNGGVTWLHGDPRRWSNTNDIYNLTVNRNEDFGYNLGYFFASARLRNGACMAQQYEVQKNPAGVYEGRGGWSQDGVHWCGPTSIVYSAMEEFESTVWLSSLAMELPSGAVVVVGYGCRAGDLARRTNSSFLFETLDHGKTFHYLSTIATLDDLPWGAYAGEPALACLDDGSLLCIMRTGDGGFQTSGPSSAPDMLQARSYDGGRTWPDKKRIFPGVMPKLLRLSSGVLVCAFGRPGNNLIFSRGHGISWGGEMAMIPPDIHTTGYLDLMEVAPNRLLVVYDAIGSVSADRWLWEPPPPVNIIWGVYVDVVPWI